MSAAGPQRVAIVTGGAAGIGAACADLLVADGYRVVATDIAEPAAPRAGVSWVEANVADEASWAHVMSLVESDYGRLDGLVNTAGIGDSADTIDDCSPAIWERILSVNLDGTFLGCKHAVGTMRRLGTEDGSIVNFASVLGSVATGATAAYSASKAAVRQLTKSVAVYLAREGLPIRSNSVHPGYIDTRMTTDWLDEMAGEEGRPVEELRAELEALHPLGRLGKARDVAETVAFLMSPDASYVNGSELVVDGGYLAI